MIKQIPRLACLLILAFAPAGCGEKANPAVPDARRSIVASGHPEWPPIMFQNGAVIDGAGVALVKKIFDDIGVAVTFPYTGTWDQVQAKARTGEVDVLVAAYR